MDDWGRRVFWLGVVVALIAASNAYGTFMLRYRLDERDRAWKNRLDALESDVEMLKRAKLGQDDFNAEVIDRFREIIHGKHGANRR